MIKSYLPKTGNEKEQLQDLILIVAWGILLTLYALSIKNYYLAGQPPLWDNLAYQQKALNILTNWLDGDLEKALKNLYAEKTPAYLLAIASSFLLFGFNPYSPYLVSAFFGVGLMIALYLLGQELGIGKRTTFWGVIFLSLLPNFIYQNFLQTHIKFPLAFFISLVWVFLLRGIKSKENKLVFFAGIIAGIATLFNASAPGYITWGILVFLVFPEKYIQTNFKDRLKLALLFFGGAMLSCGWYFLPHLGQVLSYYVYWNNAKAWMASQYNLQGNWTDYFFYIKNIIFFQLGEKIFLGITFISGILVIRWFIKRQKLNYSEEKSKESKLITLVTLAGAIPIVFLSLRQFFANGAEIPTLPLVAVGSLAFLNRISCGITVPKFLLSSLLPICLVLSIPNLPIIEKQFSAKDLNTLSEETMKTRKEFGLGNTPMMQVFSHPIYNVNSLAWLWLLNPKIDKDLVHRTTEKHLLFFPEDGEKIASKLTKFPFLIKSEFPGTIIKGEPFHTFNRLHSEINSAIKEQNQFIKLKKINLENEKFPIYFLINKNFSVLRPKGEATDGWLEWESEVEFFSSRKTKFIWHGVPIRKMDSFKLVNKDNQASFINMTFNKILPNGKYEYQSEIVPATDKLLTFIVMPEFAHLLLPASKRDKRMLAFNQVETKVIKYD